MTQKNFWAVLVIAGLSAMAPATAFAQYLGYYGSDRDGVVVDFGALEDVEAHQSFKAPQLSPPPAPVPPPVMEEESPRAYSQPPAMTPYVPYEGDRMITEAAPVPPPPPAPKRLLKPNVMEETAPQAPATPAPSPRIISYPPEVSSQKPEPLADIVAIAPVEAVPPLPAEDPLPPPVVPTHKPILLKPEAPPPVKTETRKKIIKPKTEIAPIPLSEPLPMEDVTQQIVSTPPALESENKAQIDAAPEVQTEAAAVPSMADLSLAFDGHSSDLTPDAESKLRNVIKQLSGMPETRLQVRAYAAGEDGSKSSARRISLSRALAVRSFLMDNGIRPTRVDVRALGTETDRSPLDRADLIFAR